MPSPSPQITALLPVGSGTDPDHLGRAIDSLRTQTRRPAHLLLVANGLSDTEMASLSRIAQRWPDPLEVRVLTLPAANLAAALNLGLRESPTRLVARMDADDLSLPDRLERQFAFMSANLGLAAVGCAWEVVSPSGTPRAIMRPPADPARMAWSLLLGNSLAHGSMLLDRQAILDAGGYDERLSRAQDYDLWLRLTSRGRRIAACPEVLYRYTERTEPGVAASSKAQAHAAAGSMLNAWSALPRCEPAERDRLAGVLGNALLKDHGGDVAPSLESLMDADHRAEHFLAVLWARDRFPSLQHRAVEICRRARVREVAARIAAAGATRLWLWGAGQHTRRLLEHPGDLGLPLAGLADDAAAGATRLGHAVIHPRDIPPGEHVLISSDLHEERMWAASRPHRDRGVRVWRLYGGD